MEPQPLVLSLINAGTPEHHRFKICDSSMRWFTGQDWTETEGKALLFSDRNSALWAMQRLLLADHGHFPVRRFRAPVYVDLFSDKDISTRDIQAWAVKVARLIMETPRHGNGPEGALGLCSIDWGQLEEVPEAKPEKAQGIG